MKPTHKPFRRSAAVVAVILLAAAGGYLLLRAGNAARPTSLAADEGDMTAAEAGNMAGPEFRTTRRQHVANRKRYLALAGRAVPATADEAASFADKRLQTALTDSPADREFLRTVPADVRDGLARQLGLVLRVASGLPLEDYLAALPPQAVADDAAAFAAAYEANRSFRDGANNAVRWADEPAGVVAAARWVGSGENIDLLSREFREKKAGRDAQIDFWQGGLVQGAKVTHHPPTDFKAIVADGTKVLLVEAAIVVQSSDDAFPVQAQVWYDPATRRWWTLSASRRSAVRATRGPALSY